MPGSQDYYETLGVDRGATQGQIKTAYRKLARELHPDVNKAADAAERFARVQEAYDILSDEEKRRNYDQWGSPDPAPGGFGGGRPSGTYTWSNVAGRPGPGDFSDFDASSIFEEIFGRAGGAGPFSPGARGRQRASRGRDISSEVVVEFLEAVRGGTQRVRVTRGGKTQTIEVTVPPGVADGTRLRMRGAGAPGVGGAPPGDLILTVRVAPHRLFRREGNDVLIDLPLTIAEATLGAAVRVPTLTGSAELTVPPGVSSGQRLRLRGMGIGAEGRPAGDLLAVVRIVAPKDLSPADREALRSMAERLPPVRQGPEWNA